MNKVETLNGNDTTGCTVQFANNVEDRVIITGHYTAECRSADGQLKWADEIENLVVTVGKNNLLDMYFAGASYNAAWYMGLVDNSGYTNYAAGDTLASHAGWLEFLDYTFLGSSINRATPSWNLASGGTKSTTATTYNISGSGSILGALMCTTQARNTASDGGIGVLYSVGTFSGGARTVASGDIVLVTYTASV